MAKRIRRNPNRIPVSKADVVKAKKAAEDRAVTLAWSIFFTCLRDKEGYDIDGLQRVWKEVEDLSESIAKGYCSVEDLRNVLREEAGVLLK